MMLKISRARRTTHSWETSYDASDMTLDKLHNLLYELAAPNCDVIRSGTRLDITIRGILTNIRYSITDRS